MRRAAPRPRSNAVARRPLAVARPKKQTSEDPTEAQVKGSKRKRAAAPVNEQVDEDKSSKKTTAVTKKRPAVKRRKVRMSEDTTKAQVKRPKRAAAPGRGSKKATAVTKKRPAVARRKMRTSEDTTEAQMKGPERAAAPVTEQVDEDRAACSNSKATGDAKKRSAANTTDAHAENTAQPKTEEDKFATENKRRRPRVQYGYAVQCQKCKRGSERYFWAMEYYKCNEVICPKCHAKQNLQNLTQRVPNWIPTNTSSFEFPWQVEASCNNAEPVAKLEAEVVGQRKRNLELQGI